MGTSAGVVSISVGEKRKAETMNPEDSGESEGGAEYEEGPVVDKEEEFEKTTKWEYDSFEDQKYESDEQPEYSDKEAEKKWRYFNRTVIESKGFFKSSKEFPQEPLGGICSAHNLEDPAGDYGTVREFCTLMTITCIKKYNEEKKKDVRVEEILRVNFISGPWSKYYITFAAKESDSSDAPLVEYQAKTAWRRGAIYPIFCRRTPPPPTKEV